MGAVGFTPVCHMAFPQSHPQLGMGEALEQKEPGLGTDTFPMEISSQTLRESSGTPRPRGHQDPRLV